MLAFSAMDRIRADAQIIGYLAGGFVAFQTQLDSIGCELLAVLTGVMAVAPCLFPLSGSDMAARTVREVMADLLK